MFLGRIGHFLGGELLEGADHAEASVARFDDIVDIAIFGCLVRVGEQVAVFILFHLDELLGVLGSLGILGIEHAYGTLGTHHGDLS